MNRNHALLSYAAAAACVIVGIGMAATRFPDGFDWFYTVISKLASRKHNPTGGVWLSGSLLAAMLLLWPVAGRLGRDFADQPRPRAALAALRVGIAAGVLLAVEGLLALDLSRFARKAHEALALVALVGFYAGVLGLHLQRMRRAGSVSWPALLVLLPLVAIGASQLALYFDQRELGWVNTAWRELGVPVWLSFAFWQWLAVAFLGIGLGHLVITGEREATRR